MRRPEPSPPMMTPANGPRIDLTICGPVDEEQAAELCRLAHLRLSASAEQLVVRTAGRVDLSVVEALARLRLLTRRRGVRLVVSAAAGGENPATLSVQALLDFAGLDLADPDESC